MTRRIVLVDIGGAVFAGSPVFNSPINASPDVSIESDLLGKLVSWYDFGPSNVFLDAHGSNTLTTASGSSAPNTDEIFQGPTFQNNKYSSADIMKKDSPVGLSDTPSTGMTVVCWVYGRMTNGVIARWESGQQSFCLHGNDTGGTGYDAKFYASTNGSNSINALTGYIVNGDTDWHFHAGWLDPATGKIYGQMDNGSISETTLGGTLNLGTGPLIVGCLLESGAGLAQNIIDSFAIFDAPLTSDERAWLYNAGAGRSYSDLTT